MSPFELSIFVSLAATALSAVVGIPVGLLLSRPTLPLRSLWLALVTLPLVLPPTVMGYYLLVLLSPFGPVGSVLEALGMRVVFSTPGAVVAAWVASVPFTIRGAVIGFEAVEPSLVAASRTLGYGPIGVFRTVSLPLAMPAILAGLALTLARALGEFGATLMVAGNIPGVSRTLSLALYDAVQAGRMAQANEMALVLLGMNVVFLVLLSALSKGTRI